MKRNPPPLTDQAQITIVQKNFEFVSTESGFKFDPCKELKKFNNFIDNFSNWKYISFVYALKLNFMIKVM